jgi:hypothetical protein
MTTAAEILSAINALPAEEHAAFTTGFQNDQGAVVKQARSKAFAAGKAEGKGDTTRTATDLTAAQERVTALETELEQLKAKTPDAAALVEAERKKWEPKVRKAEEERDTARQQLLAKDVDLTYAEFYAELTKPAEDGTRVDPEWAKDVARSRWGSRIAPKEGGGVRVLQLEGEQEYDAPDASAAVRLLAADARKAVPARYMLADVDSGSGVTNGGAGMGRSGGYDPVAAGKAMAAKEKQSGATQNLAYT